MVHQTLIMYQIYQENMILGLELKEWENAARLQNSDCSMRILIITTKPITKMKVTPRCEGKESEQDYSFDILQMNQEFLEMEKGIKIFDFEAELASRSLYVQFEVLAFMTTTSRHTSNKLFKDPVQFSYNRYDNILPYEYSMVKLGTDYTDPMNYINANFISTVIEGYSIIATQGPLTSTVTNFWKMIDQNDVNIIMMFCNLQQKNKIKCVKYWPCKDIEAGILSLGEGFQVEFLGDEDVKQHLVLRRFKLTKNGKSRQILQYHWKNWVDNSAPREQDFQYIDYLLRIAIEAAKTNQRIVTHCSGGVGRTGTFISLFNIRVTLDYFKEHENEIPHQEMKISIFGTVRRLREQRWRMVFVLQQYEFIYAFTCAEIKRLFTKSQ